MPRDRRIHRQTAQASSWPPEEPSRDIQVLHTQPPAPYIPSESHARPARSAPASHPTSSLLTELPQAPSVPSPAVSRTHASRQPWSYLAPSSLAKHRRPCPPVHSSRLRAPRQCSTELLYPLPQSLRRSRP